MRRIAFVIFRSFLLISVFSCHKSSVQTGPLTAKWDIINDSINAFSAGGSNYIGTPNDYYNFNANGTLVIKEDASLYNSTYSMPAADQVDIVYYLSNGAQLHRSYYITNLTAHTVTLTLRGASLGPAQRQTINLKK